ncbi:MAG: nucleoside deaminase [Muribaculaceae bacterium]|nr:nucleoside deaminase [Muribaculaceae bacterium]
MEKNDPTGAEFSFRGLLTGNPDEYYMRQALLEAEKGGHADEVPIGAVIVSGGRIIARAHNLTERLNDVTAHAEMLAVTSAAQALGGKYLTGCTLYVTVEPCPMCAGALGWSQIGRIVYGASDPKRGYLRVCAGGISPLHPKTEVTYGVLEEECGDIMKDFFRNKRRKR